MLCTPFINQSLFVKRQFTTKVISWLKNPNIMKDFSSPPKVTSSNCFCGQLAVQKPETLHNRHEWQRKGFKSLHLGSWKLQYFTLSDSFWLLPCVAAGLWDPFNEPPEGISHKAWNPQLPHLRWWVRHWLLQETGNVLCPSECVAQSRHTMHRSFFPERLNNFPKFALVHLFQSPIVKNECLSSCVALCERPQEN